MIRDYNQFLFEVRQRGREEKSLAIAEKLIKLGYPTKEIVLITDLSER